ncbi:MAG: para-nitrobenzyl esterase [Patiriisocius sp.]|jgi:para-nitrobenzyl esterase
MRKLMTQHRLGSLVTAAFALLCLTSCQQQDDARTVVLEGTRFVGIQAPSAEVVSFLGVPFAQPPVANLRWQRPKPWVSGKTLYSATKFAPACMQGPHLSNWYKDVITDFGGEPENFITPQVSEDCLYLNIWRPDPAVKVSLPVVVFIHGGSNKGGWSFEPNYQGEKLSQKGVVVVTIAYRLGIFGFFSHPQMRDANFGLYDQIAALEWVQKNIHAFGGDANNVTVMGESSGANNIDYLLVSPLSKGLFSKAIHQSGGSSLTNRSIRQEHLKRGATLSLQLLGANAQDPINQLRSFSAEDILTATETAYAGHYFDPVVDGDSVPITVVDAVKGNKMHPVDLLIGSNDDEWLMYLDGINLETWFTEEVTESQAVKLRELIKLIEGPRRQLDLLYSAKYYVCPSLLLADQVAQSGKKAYVYSFNRHREGLLAESMGAYHGAELPYIFDTHDDWLPTADQDRQLTEAMQTYWVNFARSGNPNGEESGNGSSPPNWPEYAANTDTVQVLDHSITRSAHGSQFLCGILSPH